MGVKQDARPQEVHARRAAEHEMQIRLLACHERRMLRTLHDRWPYRRSHCRHDLHWLVRVRSRRCRCASGRAHSLGALCACNRRPEGA